MKRVTLLIGVILLCIFLTSCSDTGSSTTGEGKYINVPTYGFLKCEEQQTSVSLPSSGFITYSSEILDPHRAGDTLPQTATVVLKHPDCDELKDYKNSALLWTVCTIGSTCNLNEGETATHIEKTKNLFICNNQLENSEVSIQLAQNQFVKTQYQGATTFGSAKIIAKGGYRITFRPYIIQRYDVFSDINGHQVANTRDCAFSGTISEINLAIESIASKGSLPLQESTIADKASLRSPGATLTYLSNFIPTVPQYNLFQEGAMTKYCYDKKIYAVTEIETPGGLYKVANTGTNAQERIVGCCNAGDCSVGYSCEDFSCEEISGGGYCDALNKCDIVGYLPQAGKTVVWQECINNRCVNKEKTVACNYATDCPGGYCDVDADNPDNNRCVTFNPNDHCGNGACEYSLGETVQTCRKDCSDPSSGDGIPIWVWIIVVGLVLIITLLLLFRRRKKPTGAF